MEAGKRSRDSFRETSWAKSWPSDWPSISSIIERKRKHNAQRYRAYPRFTNSNGSKIWRRPPAWTWRILFTIVMKRITLLWPLLNSHFLRGACSSKIFLSIKEICYLIMIIVSFDLFLQSFSDETNLCCSVNLKNLMKYSRDVAHYSTKLPYLDFASKASGGPDIQLFDFTSMYSAANASCAKKTYLKCCQPNIKLEPTSSTYSLLMLCGDSLLQPVS